MYCTRCTSCSTASAGTVSNGQHWLGNGPGNGCVRSAGPCLSHNLFWLTPRVDSYTLKATLWTTFHTRPIFLKSGMQSHTDDVDGWPPCRQSGQTDRETENGVTISDERSQGATTSDYNSHTEPECSLPGKLTELRRSVSPERARGAGQYHKNKC